MRIKHTPSFLYSYMHVLTHRLASVFHIRRSGLTICLGKCGKSRLCGGIDTCHLSSCCSARFDCIFFLYSMHRACAETPARVSCRTWDASLYSLSHKRSSKNTPHHTPQPPASLASLSTFVIRYISKPQPPASLASYRYFCNKVHHKPQPPANLTWILLGGVPGALGALGLNMGGPSRGLPEK